MVGIATILLASSVAAQTQCFAGAGATGLISPNDIPNLVPASTTNPSARTAFEIPAPNPNLPVEDCSDTNYQGIQFADGDAFFFTSGATGIGATIVGSSALARPEGVAVAAGASATINHGPSAAPIQPSFDPFGPAAMPGQTATARAQVIFRDLRVVPPPGGPSSGTILFDLGFRLVGSLSLLATTTSSAPGSSVIAEGGLQLNFFLDPDGPGPLDPDGPGPSTISVKRCIGSCDDPISGSRARFSDGFLFVAQTGRFFGAADSEQFSPNSPYSVPAGAGSETIGFGCGSEFEVCRVTFEAPVDTPVDLAIEVTAVATSHVYTNTDSALILEGWSNAGLVSTISFPTSEPVALLPEGYTLEIPSAGVVDNQYSGAPIDLDFDFPPPQYAPAAVPSLPFIGAVLLGLSMAATGRWLLETRRASR